MRQFRDSVARRLYLHTKLSNPHYPPEIQAETTLINFTVTQAGLSDQLNVLVLGKERADLSEMSEVLVKQQTGFKIKMGELEDEPYKACLQRTRSQARPPPGWTQGVKRKP